MKINELHSGIYKIRKSSTTARYNNNTVHLLRVKGVGESMLYFFDHDTLGQHPKNLDLGSYEILARYDTVPEVNVPKIKIEWCDSSGQCFQFIVRDAWALKNVFEELPWLKDAFGYVPKKKALPQHIQRMMK